MTEQQEDPVVPTAVDSGDTVSRRRPTIFKQLCRGAVLGLVIFVLSLLVTIFL